MWRKKNSLGKKHAPRKARGLISAFAIALVSLAGCTTATEYIHNGFKVGPNYKKPPAPVAEHWIDANDKRIRSDSEDDSQWWKLFNDPVLDDLVQSAYKQNLTLKEAGFRVLQARSALGIAIGEFFPQDQYMTGSFTRKGVSQNVANRVATPQRWFGTWDYGFALSWELDFWGRFRRAIESADDRLDASVEEYDDVLVTLIGDVATNYVRRRTYEQQLEYTRANVKLQTEILNLATARYKGGQTSKLDTTQAMANLAATERMVPQLERQIRQTDNRLCVLLGISPEDLNARLGKGSIPTAPSSVAVGIPADLLRRRPDVRRAERHVAAQSEQIGIAEAEFYPAISLNATSGWSAQNFKDLLAHNSFRGTVGPAFKWEILNYGRILNNVRLQDAHFHELVAKYQQTALKANAEVEDGLIRFTKGQEETEFAKQSVDAEMESVREAMAQYKNGLTDFNRVAVLEDQLVDRQNQLAQAQSEIASGLIDIYRALGGGWQIRLNAVSSVDPLAGSPILGAPALAIPAPVPATVK